MKTADFYRCACGEEIDDLSLWASHYPDERTKHRLIDSVYDPNRCECEACCPQQDQEDNYCGGY